MCPRSEDILTLAMTCISVSSLTRWLPRLGIQISRQESVVKRIMHTCVKENTYSDRVVTEKFSYSDRVVKSFHIQI